MICRVWRGWTTPENAPAYQALLTNEIMPAFRTKNIEGLGAHQGLARPVIGPDGNPEIEHMTLIWFSSLKDIERFAGADATRANIPEAARAVLKRWDVEALHYDIFDVAP